MHVGVDAGLDVDLDVRLDVCLDVANQGPTHKKWIHTHMGLRNIGCHIHNVLNIRSEPHTHSVPNILHE